MWFIFPQALGLGRSAMSERYAIRSPEEGRAYLAHPVLGPRLRECTALVNAWLKTRTLEEIFGEVDAKKWRSCVEVFDPGGAKGRGAY